MEFKKGDVVIYNGVIPYILANSQSVNKKGEEIVISSNVNVENKNFSLKEEPKKEVEEKKEEIKNEVEKEVPKKTQNKLKK